MSSYFREVGSVDPHQIWEGVAGRVVDGDGATLAVIELDPGAVVPEHSHLHEQMGVLVRGELTFTIGGETQELRPGAMWSIPAHVAHDVRVGAQGAVLVEAFAPRREDWDRLERRVSSPRWPEG